MSNNKGKRILIAGDAMLDIYHYGRVDRISPEAPVPVFLETGRVGFVPGGAANVAVNIVATGVETSFFSLVGSDENGDNLVGLLAEKGIDMSLVVKSDERQTISKCRYIGPGNQQVLRVDEEIADDIDLGKVEGILSEIGNRIDEFGIFILSDYKKGFLTVETSQALIRLAKENGIPVLVDVKERRLEKYRGATILKPNRKELSELSGRKVDTTEEAINAAKQLCEDADSQYVLATLGAEGMILVDRSGLIKEIRSTAKEVYDVTGAGDTSIAYLAAEMLAGKTIEDAMVVANYAAGVQVSKSGTAVVYPDEVYAVMQETGEGENGKILDWYKEGGLSALKRHQKDGDKIVFTNGCFDLLHAGHVSYLKKAKCLGDILVVGVNSDDSVKRLKGKDRPINTLADRMLVLSVLEFVDYVVAFSEDTPAGLIEAITPDVLVKGGDYKPHEIVGADHVIANGGEVRVLDFVEGKSTTGIIEKMQRS